MELMTKETLLTFEDVALAPTDFSNIRSRSDVVTGTLIGRTFLKLPIISSNMTSVHSTKLANKLQELGGMSIIPRFNTIEENVKLFKEASIHSKPWVCVGTSLDEFKRAVTLVENGVKVILIDVAMGNNITTVTQYNRLVTEFGDSIDIIVGDVCLGPQVTWFLSQVSKPPTAFLVGVGCGSSCETRQVTGIGIPVMSAIQSCTSMHPEQKFILNGGIRNSGDFCKALAAGCSAVIIGRLFAQCQESYDYDPKFEYFNQWNAPKKRLYSGSASLNSYVQQGKEADFRAPEGASYYVDINNTVENLFNQMNGGLRSSMSYLNAMTLTEFRQNAKFIKVSQAGNRESTAYGKNL